jgi:hypothetical protein
MWFKIMAEEEMWLDFETKVLERVAECMEVQGYFIMEAPVIVMLQFFKQPMRLLPSIRGLFCCVTVFGQSLIII